MTLKHTFVLQVWDVTKEREYMTTLARVDRGADMCCKTTLSGHTNSVEALSLLSDGTLP